MLVFKAKIYLKRPLEAIKSTNTVIRRILLLMFVCIYFLRAVVEDLTLNHLSVSLC